ncbi:MAG: hypothetical protein E4H07_08280 [Nitrosomonadales bacterium]|nr:MAG: hypothetical protein E4H07_08280 [Nitrosomonadales bacterium]
MTQIPLHHKQLILEDAKKSILKNYTLEEIAVSHGISKRRLISWLMSLGEEYRELRRQLWIDNMLEEAKKEIDNATAPFPLAKANAKWEAATWYAERKDQQRYGGYRANDSVDNNSLPTQGSLNENSRTLLDYRLKKKV